VLVFLVPVIVGHCLSWYDGSLHHLIHHASIIAPGCNVYHSDIIVVSAHVWIPDLLSSNNAAGLPLSPLCSSIPASIVTNNGNNNRLSLPITPSENSDDENDIHDITSGFSSSYLQQIPSQWDLSINGHDFLPVYNHHHHHHHQQQQQQQQQHPQEQQHNEQATAMYDDDHVWYERLRSMATSIGSEQQSSSDSSSNDIQQHHQLFDVYSQHLPPPIMTSVSIDPQMAYYSANHGLDPYHHHHHLAEYQTMFSF
jgi:hypothetical protein